MNFPFPKLTVRADNSGGIEILADIKKRYDCVEFSLREDAPKMLLQSAWVQFMPAEMRSDILCLANEIVRRANAYEYLEKTIDQSREAANRMYDQKCAEHETATYYACALAEIASKIKDKDLKKEAVGYLRERHRKELVDNARLRNPNSGYEEIMRSVDEIIMNNDYSKAPIQQNRLHVLGINTVNISEAECSHLIIANVAARSVNKPEPFTKNSDGTYTKAVDAEMYSEHPIGTIYKVTP